MGEEIRVHKPKSQGGEHSHNYGRGLSLDRFCTILEKETRKYPRDIWDVKILYTASVAKIYSKYKPILRKMYGDVSVVEMYTATEGAFGQQMYEYPYWRPNYDLYFFEVETDRETKILYELERDEWGKLIVSTPLFPRYRIGDLVEARVRTNSGFLVEISHGRS
ncbi:hypothetical protein GF326_11570 [Candidatus Bathyarchaeota archaeon]|nr:hypothetical protein [Candidatus Bathyarchaeota archaeon]